jgi:hypothetical protein
MEPEAEAIARRAANRLAPQLGARLPMTVEAALQGGTGASDQFIDAGLIVALAGLVLNIVKFAWDLHKDARAKASTPSREATARQIRLQIALPSSITTAQRDQIITVVLDELPH